MRFFIEIAYVGTKYHGWQSQNNAIGVQDVIKQKLNLLLKEPINLVGSSRTDTGVHAEQQIGHFDSLNLELEKISSLLYKLNRVLPKDIAVLDAYPVSDTAHSRFDAISRTYQYRIASSKSPFLVGLCYPLYKKINVELMNEAAIYLKGEHDFEALCKSKSNVKNNICMIYEAYWYTKNDVLVFEIKANRFLWGMVRIIVGTLLAVGLEKISPQDFEEILLSRSRSKASASVPSDGLFLYKVEYSNSILKKC
jgi:tRNA pseudouridine38-40 synthase